MLATRWLIRLGCLFVVPGLVVGCGGSQAPKTYPVEGTVTLDKKPLEKGVIYFRTVQTGAFDSIEIHDGKFHGPAGEGERRVEIASYQTKTVGSGAMKGEVQENTIPKQYNTESKLSATIKAGAPNQFTFELTSQ